MSRKPSYVHELPFIPRKELCNILDADKKWKELGGAYMNIDHTNLILIGQAVLREESPTGKLLNMLGDQNKSIKRLFLMLAKMRHFRAMRVLLPYVDEKYQRLLVNDNGDTSTMTIQNFLDIDSQTTISSSARPNTSQAHNNQSSNNAMLHHGSRLESSNNTHKKMNICGKQDKVTEQSRKPISKMMKNTERSTDDNCPPNNFKDFDLQKYSPNEYAKCGAKNENDLSENSLPDTMKITYKEIIIATKEFDKTQVLGSGGFGIVYRGKWKGTSVAIKRLMPPKRQGTDSSLNHLISLKQSLNELNILKCCRFDYILPLYGVSLDGPEPCLVYQLMLNGSLEDWLLSKNNTPPLTWSQRSNIAECTAIGLNYLHTTPGKPLVHGDIKSANILLDSNMEAKIGDFGLTREGPSGDKTHVKVSKLHGTKCYLPPEYLRGGQLSYHVDVYSYGIVLLEMATGLRPYDKTRGSDAKMLVDYVNDFYRPGLSDSMKDSKAGEENMMWFRELMNIGKDCTCSDKKKRPTMMKVLETFDNIKGEVSMMENIRKLSNDRNSIADPSKLKQLSPEALQKYYDEMMKNNRENNPSVNLAVSDNHKVSVCEGGNNLSFTPHTSDVKDLNTDKTGAIVVSRQSTPANQDVENTRQLEELSLQDLVPANIPDLSMLNINVSDVSATPCDLNKDVTSESVDHDSTSCYCSDHSEIRKT